MNRSLTFIILLLLFSCSFRSSKAQVSHNLDPIFKKKQITVVITDSGLGGLSVMDDIAKKMKASGCYKKVNLIFVNALFDAYTGYNSLHSRKEKINIFNNVLNGIYERYHPDIIFIACNTLSVIYKETDFAGISKIPIIDIVEPGVQMIREKLEKDTSSDVIIFGTETTIEENSHKKALLDLNIAKERIVTMACPQLQSYIEQNPSGEETEMLISLYLGEALEELPRNHGQVFISLNCSHFGYSEFLWRKAISNSPFISGEILNPNYLMGDVLADEKYRYRFYDTRLKFLVVSKVVLTNEESMYKVFSESSPELANALKNYKIIYKLF